MTHVHVPIQSSADDFESDWRSPRITIKRNYTVTGNGKKEYTGVSSNGKRKVSTTHNYNNYKLLAEQIVNDTVFGWKTSFSCNPENEAEVVQILYAVQRMASDRRAPRDMETYGIHADDSRGKGYERGRLAYYNAYVAWKEAGYPVEVTILDANSTNQPDQQIVLEQYTMTIADATELTVDTEEEVVVVEVKNFDCPHCGAKYRSYAGRYNHLKKGQCRVLNSQ